VSRVLRWLVWTAANWLVNRCFICRGKKSDFVPSSVEPFYSAIVKLTDAVCKEHLNDEYADLARRLAATLARKRPSPIVRGKPEVWACAIVYALGYVNFLFEKSQNPHMKADELCKAFGVSRSSGANKAKVIQNMLKMIPLDPDWCLHNPLIGFLEVNGVIVDIRLMPREIQVIAYEKGLIPYIPADQ
jgi:hypothetical protein